MADKELKGKLEGALARRHDEITHILEDFGVPLLPASEEKAGWLRIDRSP